MILQTSSSREGLLHLFVSVQQLIKNAIAFCLYSFSLHHRESKVAFAIETHTLDATVEIIADTAFLLQATAVFTRTHDSTLRTRALKKNSATQGRVFSYAMRRHEEKVIFETKILEENLVLELFRAWLRKQQWLGNHWVIRVSKWSLWSLESEVITVSIASMMLILLTLLEDDQNDHSEQERLDMILLCLYNDDRFLR